MAAEVREVDSPLSSEERSRYARHLMLPHVGAQGQAKLKQGRVLLIGAGGLGSPAALYLAAAGVGTLGIVDPDVVDLTNLQRQVIHGSADIDRLKVESAAERIGDLNPNVVVESHPVVLSSENAMEIIAEYDLVIDGTDNFPTRYLANDACVLLGKPNVYGSIFRFEGQNSVFGAPGGPCYRCLFAEPPPPGMVPSCAEGGVLGVLPGIVGSIQALEAIKLLLGIGDTLAGRLLLFDALSLSFRELKLKRAVDCPVCGDAPTIHELIDYDQFCGVPSTEERNMETVSAIPEITATELKARLDGGDNLTIVDVREPEEWEIGNLGDQGARLIPLGEIPARLNELDPEAEIVLQCRSGGRSAKALRYLKERGYTRLLNLKGGIVAWSDEVDPSVPKY